ncbi:MAG: hypothetical protein H6752_00110 [Candidatus Omnitrophica bacterium]|nr:hypothetical protein [Candidatus Omnitrophota bacterium]
MDSSNRRYVEATALIVGWAGLFTALYLTAGGPLSWDELLYMETSWNLKEVPWILNRYAHIYFQSIFMHMVGDPIEGAKVYWSFLISSSILGTYLCARRMAVHYPILTGLIAVALFFHLRLPFRYSGTPYADFCLMFFGIWSAAFFLMGSEREGRWRRVLFILLGLFLFLSIKSKEHGMVFFALLLGLGRVENTFTWEAFKHDLVFVLIGGLSGVLLLVVADTVALGNPLYSLWPGNVESVLDYNVGSFQERSPDSWLGILTTQTLAIPFTLYLMAPFVGSMEGWKRRIVWSVPILFVLFLTATLVFIRYRVSDRQVIAMLPLLCVGGSLFFQSFLRNPESNRWFVLSALPAFLIVLFRIPERVAATGGWTPFPLESAVIYPGGALLLVTLAALLRDRANKGEVLLIGIVFWMALLPGVRANLSNLYHDTAGEKSRERFLPFEEFRNQISLQGEPRCLVSPHIHDELGMLGRSSESCSMMFDLYFKTDTNPDQFTYELPSDQTPMSCDFDGVFLTEEDLARIDLSDCNYTIFKAKERGLIFLKNPSP